MDTKVQKKVFYNKFSPSSVSYSAYPNKCLFHFAHKESFLTDLEENVQTRRPSTREIGGYEHSVIDGVSLLHTT
jgi:hypothetical protein